MTSKSVNNSKKKKLDEIKEKQSSLNLELGIKKSVPAVLKLGGKRKKLIIPAIFAFLIILFYANTLFNGFIIDDRILIEQNQENRSLMHIPKALFGCAGTANYNECIKDYVYYRPFRDLIFMLVYQISPQPWIFHLVNLICFFVVAYLIFVFSKTITKNELFSLLTGLFFIIHPINNEIVNWPSTLSDPLFFLFFLLTLIYYVRYRNTGKRRDIFLVIVFYFLAMLSKESAVPVVPLAIFGLDLIIFKINLKKIFHWEEFRKYALLAAPVAVYFLMRLAAIGSITKLPTSGSHLSIAENINVFFRLFIYYLREVFFPYPLRFVHYFQIRSDFLHPAFIFSFAAVLLFFFLIIFLLRKRKNFLAFCLIWLLITYLPILIFFNAAGENVFAERYLFASSLSAAWIISYFLAYLWQNNKRPIVLFFLGFSLVASWFIIFPRNKTWKDNITFLRATLIQTPQASHIREYLADELKGNGDLEAAKAEYDEIIKRDLQYMYIGHIYSNLADYYRQKREMAKAEEYYQKAIEVSGDMNYKVYNNLGAFYIENGQYLKALPFLCTAMAIDQTAQEPQANLSYVASIFESAKDDDLRFVYEGITSGQIFRKNEEQRIEYTKKICSDKICSVSFSSLPEKGEILLPFLIMGTIDSNSAMRAEESYFNAQNGEITLGIDSKYKNDTINFIFPTCSGAYYEVKTSP